MKKIFAVLSLTVLLVAVLAASKKSSLFTFQESFVDQTSDLAPTTLFTPAEDGDFQVSLYNENVGAQVSNSQATLSWTDDVQQESFTRAASLTIQGQGGAVISIHAKAGTPVTVSATNFASTQTYTIYVTAIGL